MEDTTFSWALKDEEVHREAKMRLSGRRKDVRWNLEKVIHNFTSYRELFNLFSRVFLFPVKNEKFIQIYANCTLRTQNRKIVG